MAVQRDTIIEYLAQFLAVENFVDYCINGLQVEGKERVSSIVTGVSANKSLFLQARESSADMIIVHHGLFWKRDPIPMALVGVLRARLAVLIKNDINLCAYHLPLDAHPAVGNNHHLCQTLGVTTRTSFDVGFIGNFEKSTPLEEIIKIVTTAVHPQPTTFLFGPQNSTRIAIISGSPDSTTLVEAVQQGADTFLCGGIQEQTVYLAQELAVNYINAGHYNTEMFGIKALGEHISQKFLIPHRFIDVPNPI
ncbi:Nif3-like dinuclear metal center hexameric protein [candidate division CSSED10-310 bacterium]|uniref:Nif3-like dinuclear metal center hexameric protein n=1 Tax=candidate division CSSED10-310 bacterium TaxID=2855610 RepID=A0ABV6Z172_UNCC1